MTVNQPLVSVVMPNYNTPEEYLRAAIESVLGQTYANKLPDTEGQYCGYDFETPHPFWAFDEYGVVHGLLVGSPQLIIESGHPLRSVIELDGMGQYIELRREVFDSRSITISAWIKPEGAEAGQRVFHLGDGGTKYMELTPHDAATGKLRFAITMEGPGFEETLQGAGPAPAGVWTHVAVVISERTGRLYVDGLLVDTASFSVNPDQLNAPNLNATPNHNFVGRGLEGGFFSGRIDEFRIYSRALDETRVRGLISK